MPDSEVESMSIGEGVFWTALSAWGVTPEEVRQLLGESDGEWTKAQIESAELVNGIYINLRFLPPKQAHAWPRKPNDNPLFRGRPPMELMLTGREGLERVLNLIMSENGGPL
jgi:hypothetical protein